MIGATVQANLTCIARMVQFSSFLVGSMAISCHPTSRGSIFYFYISRPIYFGRLVLFFLVVVVPDTTPKSRRTEGTVCVTKFCNRRRKTVTFCRNIDGKLFCGQCILRRFFDKSCLLWYNITDEIS